MTSERERGATHIETEYMSIPADEANLRDFVARAERDLATDADGTLAAYPEFRADLERAAEAAREELAAILAERAALGAETTWGRPLREHEAEFLAEHEAAR